MDKWTEYELFVHVAELGSLSKAADTLGLSRASATRHLAALEERLGARLIERSTRRSFVTEIGQNFYERCKSVLSEMQEAVEKVNAQTIEPAGVLRVTASLSMTLQHIAPLLSGFAQRYPKVRVKMVVANRYQDIIENDIDVAIRTREFEPDSSLISRHLAETRRVLAASPEYLERHGIPDHPQALAKHQLLLYTHHSPDELKFRRGNELVTLPTTPMLEANDGQVLKVAALHGQGILAQPTYVIHDDLIAGRLLPLLTDWELPRMSIKLVYRHRRYIPAKTRAFIDFLAEDFRINEYESQWESLVRNGART